MERLTRDYLEQEYINKEKSMKEIGKIVGCSESWIWNCLKKFNIPRRNNPKYIEKTSEEWGKTITKEFLIENYIIKKITKNNLAKFLNCDPSTIASRLIKYNISIRNISEAKKGKPSNFKGKNHSKETRKRISKALTGKSGFF